MTKKFAHAPSAELMHAMCACERKGKTMVEFHVDLLEVGERQRLCPDWGGGTSQRIDITRPTLEELGQDESAFCQNDERKQQWHDKNKVRLTQSEKSRGANSHCSVVVGHRLGAGGNLITEQQWQECERVREPHEPMFKNPFVVWARVGSECGFWGAKEVAMQMREVFLFMQWERGTGRCKTMLNKLRFPEADAVPRRVQVVMGVDQSQTHLAGKPDGIVIGKFNLGTKHRSKTNTKAASKFVMPRDVVLLEGDVNPHPVPFDVPVSDSDKPPDDNPDDDENISEAPLGQSAVNEEIAKDFGDDDGGAFIGNVTTYKEDEEGASDEAGLCHIMHADGDAEDPDHHEHLQCWEHARQLDDHRSTRKKRRVSSQPPAASVVPNLEYKVGDTCSFRLTDDSFKGLEQVAKELGWCVSAIFLSY
jgi:hypothetical protein